MRVLVLGGTGWLGAHLAGDARDRGHQVTCLTRGAAVPLDVEHVRADRDRHDALSGVAARGDRGSWWDAVIDVSQTPGHVRRAVIDLSGAGRYVFVSSVSVYADHSARGRGEDDELLPPLRAERFDSMEHYGNAKVACENAVAEAFGPDRSLIVRPGLIGGPGDYTWRTAYWPWRFAHPSIAGSVLVPNAPDFPASTIDVRDLSSWIIRATAAGQSGFFNAAAPAIALADHLAVARDTARSGAVMVGAEPDWLAAHGVSPWIGERSLPLWIPGSEHQGMNDRAIGRALAAGLRLRPLRETLRDTLEWAEEHSAEPRPSGLGDAAERELLRRLLSRARSRPGKSGL